MQSECDLSLITINYNGLADTCALIDTIPFNELSLEVIVVDNASADEEASVIEQRYPAVRVIRNSSNLGFAGGNNLGIRAARGRYLLFINNDTLLYRDESERSDAVQGLKALLARLDTDAAIGAVSPKIRFSWGNTLIQYAGFTKLSAVTVRNRAIGYNEPDNGQYDEACPTPYAHGAAMLVRREAIEQAGLMPECYFLYYEELDWSCCLRRAGYTIWYDPCLTVFHKESRATGQDSPLKTYYLTRNRLLLVKRNSPVTVRWLSYLYLVGVVAAKDIVRSIANGRHDTARATLLGVADFIRCKTGKR